MRNLNSNPVSFKEEEDFDILLDNLDNLKGYWKYDYFCVLLREFKNKDLWSKKIFLIKKQFNTITEGYFGSTTSTFSKNYSDLIKISKENDLLNVLFPVFLEAINKYPTNKRFYAFSFLIYLIKDTKLLTDFFLQIESQFLNLLDIIDNLTGYHKCECFSSLIRLFDISTKNLVFPIKDTDLWKKYLSRIKNQFLSIIKDFHILINENVFYDRFSRLISLSKEIELMKDHFALYLDVIDKLPKYEMILSFFYLIDNVQDPFLLNKFSSRIENKVNSILEDFESFLEKNHINYSNKLFKMFYAMTSSIKNLPFSNKFISRINSTFFKLTAVIGKVSQSQQYNAYIDLWGASKKLGLEIEYFPTFLETINNLDSFNKYEVFEEVIRILDEDFSEEIGNKLWKNNLPRIKNLLNTLLDPLDRFTPKCIISNLNDIIEDHPDLEDIFEEWRKSNQIKYEVYQKILNNRWN